jgi:hypothetical protein
VKPSGWIFFALSWGMILVLFVFSLARTLKRREEDASADGAPPKP